jgi:hypothetical protein
MLGSNQWALQWPYLLGSDQWALQWPYLLGNDQCALQWLWDRDDANLNGSVCPRIDDLGGSLEDDGRHVLPWGQKLWRTQLN